MGSVYVRRKSKVERDVDRAIWQEMFDQGMATWQEWIRDDRSKRAVIARKRRATDPDEEAYFFGVLTGAKKAGFRPHPKEDKKEYIRMYLDKFDELFGTRKKPRHSGGLMRRRQK